MKSDLAALRSTEHEGFRVYDEATDGLFTEVFGGNRPEDVANFLDERVRHYVDPSDPKIRVSINSRLMRLAREDERAEDEGRLAAQNLGTSLWVKSLVDETSIQFLYSGGIVPVDSTRAGIVILANAYGTELQTEEGGTIEMTPAVRQSILLHEARHSDCTGGISEAFLREVRETPDAGAQAKKFEGHACGHFHGVCPKYFPAGTTEPHPLAGKVACDHEAWGAYRVGEVFLRAVMQDPEISTSERFSAAVFAMDAATRVDVSRGGRRPDMGSGGVVP
jgi:hypothetical protein